MPRNHDIESAAAPRYVAIALVAVTALTIVSTMLLADLPESPNPLRPLAQPVAPCQPRVLPTLGGVGGNVIAASSTGIYTGIADDATGRSHPVIWRNGRVARVDTGLDPASPVAVNRQGVVVGTGFDRVDQRPMGWWWSRGTTHPLAVPDDQVATPEAITDSGRVVGAVLVDDYSHAASWATLVAQPQILPDLGGDSSSHAFAIAQDGTIGGVSLGSAGNPVLWDSRGRVQSLGRLDGLDAGVHGFDTRSNPIGQSAVAQGGSRAIRWNAAGKPAQLGALVAGREASASDAVSDVVVGSASAPALSGGSRTQAVAWIDGKAQVLRPISTSSFRGVSGTANAAVVVAGEPRAVGYSSDRVGLRVPTEWRCAR